MPVPSAVAIDTVPRRRARGLRRDWTRARRGRAAPRRGRVVRRPRLDGAARCARATRAGALASRFAPRTSTTACRRTPMRGRRSAPTNVPPANVPLTVHRVHVAARGRREPRSDRARGALRGARRDRCGLDRARASRGRSGGDDAAAAPAGRGTCRGSRPCRCGVRPPRGRSLLRPFLALPRARARRVRASPRARVGRRRVQRRHAASSATSSGTTSRRVSQQAFPGYPATLARAAAHQAEAAQLADDLAQHRREPTRRRPGGASALTLDRDALAALYRRAPYRARNLLRWFLRQHALRAPSAARLAAMLDQLALAAADARVRLGHDGAEIGFHRGRIVVHAPVVAPFAVTWHGEPTLALPHGSLEFASCIGAGIARDGARTGCRHRPFSRRRRALQHGLRPSAASAEAPAAGSGRSVLAARLPSARLLRKHSGAGPGDRYRTGVRSERRGAGCHVQWHPD